MGSARGRTGSTKSAHVEVLKVPDLDALLAGEPTPKVKGAFTTREMMDAMGIAQSTVAEKFRTAIKRGLLVYVGREKRPAVDGTMRPVPVYKVADNAKTRTRR